MRLHAQHDRGSESIDVHRRLHRHPMALDGKHRVQIIHMAEDEIQIAKLTGTLQVSDATDIGRRNLMGTPSGSYTETRNLAVLIGEVPICRPVWCA